jgi:addiction module HigA family antidote
MIRSSKHRGLKRLYERGDRSGIRPDLVDTVERILMILDSAATPQALEYSRLHAATLPMKHPVHPGRIIRNDCIEPLGLTITKAAKVLGVTRQALNNVVNCKSGISPEMAIRLSKAFGSNPETWLRMQIAYDLAQVRKGESKIKVRRQHVPHELQPSEIL